jgi:hypothetical protein
LNANNGLKHFGADPIQPCSYQFPVSNVDDAIALAAKFTSLVLGTLQNVINVFAANGDAALTTGIASVVGQEGEQEGFFRLVQKKVPNELPFLTTSTREFALSALSQNFIVPGSCSVLNTIGLKIFSPLTLLTTPQATTQPIQLSFQAPASGTKNLNLVYINQQNVPVVESFQVIGTKGSTVTIEAIFPYNEHLLNGLTIAAITNGAGPFANAQAVADATEAGPAIIIVN